MITRQEVMERLITTDIDVESLYPTFALDFSVPTNVVDVVNRKTWRYE